MLLDVSEIESRGPRTFAPMPDGERVLFVRQNEETETDEPKGRRIDVVLNWVEELAWE